MGGALSSLDPFCDPLRMYYTAFPDPGLPPMLLDALPTRPEHVIEAWHQLPKKQAPSCTRTCTGPPNPIRLLGLPAPDKPEPFQTT